MFASLSRQGARGGVRGLLPDGGLRMDRADGQSGPLKPPDEVVREYTMEPTVEHVVALRGDHVDRGTRENDSEGPMRW